MPIVCTPIGYNGPDEWGTTVYTGVQPHNGDGTPGTGTVAHALAVNDDATAYVKVSAASDVFQGITFDQLPADKIWVCRIRVRPYFDESQTPTTFTGGVFAVVLVDVTNDYFVITPRDMTGVAFTNDAFVTYEIIADCTGTPTGTTTDGPRANFKWTAANEAGQQWGVTFVEIREFNQHEVTVSSDANSAWDEEGVISVDDSTDLTLTLTPADGYHVDDVLVDDVSVGDAHGDPSYELVLDNVTDDHTVVGSAEGNVVEIVPETPIGDPTEATGTIRVDNPSARVGETVRFTVRPATGRRIGQLKRDNVSIASEVNNVDGVLTNQQLMDTFPPIPIELDEEVLPDGPPVITAQFVQGASGVPVSSYVNGFQAGFGLEDFSARSAAEERHRGLPKSS
jgi:hypothetical protein